MTPQAQRIAIAEACGWKKLYSGPEPDNRWLQPDGVHYATTDEVPNYLTDLNAMHEAERWFDDKIDDERSRYFDYLMLNAEGFPDRWECHWAVLRATAAQRAEAFLRTIGKWEED